MKAVTFFASLGAVLAAASTRRVVSLDINKPPVSLPLLDRRRGLGSYSQVIANNITAKCYYAEVAIGTPPQHVTLIVDTGSSDTWVVDKSADGCEGDLCLTLYDSHASSTVKMLDDTLFNITYQDGTRATGNMINDTLRIGGATIKSLEMGLTTTVTNPISGILGLGPRAGEASPGDYPNIMDLFYDQGLIGTKAFSLYLNTLQSPSGTVLFGGVDKSKYTGELMAVPLGPTAATQKYSYYYVALDSLSMTFDNGTTSPAFTYITTPVLLDSGATLTYLPNSTVQRLYQALDFPVEGSASRGGADDDLAWVDCGILDDAEHKAWTFDFRLGGPDGPLIRVPLHQMVIDLRPYVSEHGANMCLFGIVPSPSANNDDSDIYVLGDTFLRSAYVVFDLTNNQVALAQAKPNATAAADGSDIVEFGQDATAIPGVSGAASGITATQTATGLPGGAGRPLPTVTVTGSSTDDAAATSATGNHAPRSTSGPDWSVLGIAILTGLGILAGSTLLSLRI
ncbi:acid protease [Apiospora rasikravindrae]|uniref:Acid protease n=1 Tax=Apiospora rasikravindrae TaxID=990691 RepID=A0ABR1RNP7_9PEZI